jgi:hypothetical protein
MGAQLGWTRMVIGLALIVGARPLLRLAGAEPSGAAQAAQRGLGGRDLVIGAGLVSSLDDPSASRWTAAGIASDAFDAFAVLLAWRALPKRRRALLLLATLFGTTSGAVLLARQG